MQIKELEDRLHNSTSNKEKAMLISTLDSLYKKYDGILDKEDRSIDDDEYELD